MRLSSCEELEVGLEGLPRVEDSPQDVDAAASEGDEGMVMALAFVALAGIKGAAIRLLQRTERADRRRV